ncbi:hypothetical protein GCK32_018028 [Trichostrongylus colubriformis]|uniref:Uncharacterized protein n=1 Tax=Trichostrongylus colubriformis TaxID=6319 RepID=A0AAN8FX99_TRICO
MVQMRTAKVTEKETVSVCVGAPNRGIAIVLVANRSTILCVYGIDEGCRTTTQSLGVSGRRQRSPTGMPLVWLC